MYDLMELQKRMQRQYAANQRNLPASARRAAVQERSAQRAADRRERLGRSPLATSDVPGGGRGYDDAHFQRQLASYGQQMRRKYGPPRESPESEDNADLTPEAVFGGEPEAKLPPAKLPPAEPPPSVPSGIPHASQSEPEYTTAITEPSQPRLPAATLGGQPMTPAVPPALRGTEPSLPPAVVGGTPQTPAVPPTLRPQEPRLAPAVVAGTPQTPAVPPELRPSEPQLSPATIAGVAETPAVPRALRQVASTTQPANGTQGEYVLPSAAPTGQSNAAESGKEKGNDQLVRAIEDVKRIVDESSRDMKAVQKTLTQLQSELSKMGTYA